MDLISAVVLPQSWQPATCGARLQCLAVSATFEVEEIYVPKQLVV
jgi:hypothetical protein